MGPRQILEIKNFDSESKDLYPLVGCLVVDSSKTAHLTIINPFEECSMDLDDFIREVDSIFQQAFMFCEEKNFILECNY
jgi:hypothetical protein